MCANCFKRKHGWLPIKWCDGLSKTENYTLQMDRGNDNIDNNTKYCTFLPHILGAAGEELCGMRNQSRGFPSLHSCGIICPSIFFFAPNTSAYYPDIGKAGGCIHTGLVSHFLVVSFEKFPAAVRRPVAWSFLTMAMELMDRSTNLFTRNTIATFKNESITVALHCCPSCSNLGERGQHECENESTA